MYARERSKEIQSFRAEIVVVAVCITYFCVEQHHVFAHRNYLCVLYPYSEQ